MAAKTEKPIQLNKLKHVGDFTDGQLQAARLTIRMHLDHADYQNTITQSEIKTYATLLDRHPTVICEIIEEEEEKLSRWNNARQSFVYLTIENWSERRRDEPIQKNRVKFRACQQFAIPKFALALQRARQTKRSVCL